MDKPQVKLVGEDGNAYAIMGRCRNAAQNAGMSTEWIRVVMQEMMAGDYNHLLCTAMKYFDVIEDDHEEDFVFDDHVGEDYRDN